MRLFIALRFEDAFLAQLTAYQKELRKAGFRGNFTKRENLHLTLAFIGEYPDRFRVLKAMIKTPFSPFVLRTGKTGYFNDLMWLGLDGAGALSEYVSGLRKALGEEGIPFDNKRFSPHITLIRHCERGDALPPPPAAQAVFPRVSLMKSDFGQHGMIYTELGHVDAFDK